MLFLYIHWRKLSGNICDFYIASVFIPTLNGYFEVVTNDVDCFPQREYRYSWETKMLVSPAYSASPGVGLRVGFNSHPFIQHCTQPPPPPPCPPLPTFEGKSGRSGVGRGTEGQAFPVCMPSLKSWVCKSTTDDK